MLRNKKKMPHSTTQEIADILAKPYARLVIPDNEGTYSAEMVEFPGCIAMGDTPAEALENLESVAVDWITSAMAQDQDIPEPMDAAGYSGKLVLRMPKSLHQRAALYAERDGVSLNQFIVSGLAEQVGARAQTRMMAIQSMQGAGMILNMPTVYPSSTAEGTYLGQNSGTAFFVTPSITRERAHA